MPDDVLKRLFGYLVWRDTKAAILLFIHPAKDVTAVIDNAIAKDQEHPKIASAAPHRARCRPVQDSPCTPTVIPNT